MSRFATTSGRNTVISVISFSAILLIMSSLSTGIAFGQSTSFNTPVQISDTGGATYPWVSTSGSYVYAVWQGGSSGTLFRSSSDGGATWSPPLGSQALKIGPGGSFPIMTASGSYVYVVWTTDGKIMFAGSSNNGASFSTAKSVSSSVPGTAITPFDGSNGASVYVSFVLNNESYVTFSSNGGSTFSTPYKFSSDHEPQIAVSGSDAYVLSDDAGGIYQTTNSGASWTWSNSHNGLDGCCGAEPWVTASGTYVLSSWETKENTSQVYAVTSKNSGETWATWYLSKGISDSWAPMTGIGGDTFYVAWRTDPGTVNSQEYVTSLTGGTWTTPTAIGFTGKDNQWPFTIAASGSDAFVMWDYASTSSTWYAATAFTSNGGASWTTFTLSSSSSQAVREGDIATGAAAISGSTGYFIWQGPSGQIYFTSGTG